MSRRQQANAPKAVAPATTTVGQPTHVTHDVLLIGAGLAGINMAYRLQTQMPHLNFRVLEARDDIGGTWSVLKYPGLRSDSDMYTYGFAWRPWRHRVLGDGGEIMSYLRECVSEFGLDKRISFRHKVMKADWSSEMRQWILEVEHNGQTKTYITRWLVLSPGYFNYEKPFPAIIPGIDVFQGDVIHPQFWPADFNYADKTIIIIGSGATAITMLPALVQNGAKQVTMLQRSPSYVVSLPNPENKPTLLTRHLSLANLNSLRRIFWFYTMWMIHFMCAHFPAKVRNIIAGETRKQLPTKTPFEPHFVPAYNPWEQRLCFAKDGDFFRALHSDNADVVTGTIRAVTAKGIELDNGVALNADIIITATGLNMHFAGGIPISVDEDVVAWPDKLLWNGSMVQDVPNLFFMWGYTNVSWTLGTDATAIIACRLLKYMEKQNVHVAVPKTPKDFKTKTQAMMKLSSTYITAAEPYLPKFGSEGPWRPTRDPIPDMVHARWGNITKGLNFFCDMEVKAN